MPVSIDVEPGGARQPPVRRDAMLGRRHAAKRAVAQILQERDTLVARDEQIGEAVGVIITDVHPMRVEGSPGNTRLGRDGCEACRAVIPKEAVGHTARPHGIALEVAASDGKDVGVTVRVVIEQPDTRTEAFENRQVSVVLPVDAREDETRLGGPLRKHERLHPVSGVAWSCVLIRADGRRGRCLWR